jgi:hypothetical protein
MERVEGVPCVAKGSIKFREDKNITTLETSEQLSALWTLFELKAPADPFFGDEVLTRDAVTL